MAADYRKSAAGIRLRRPAPFAVSWLTPCHCMFGRGDARNVERSTTETGMRRSTLKRKHCDDGLRLPREPRQLQKFSCLLIVPIHKVHNFGIFFEPFFLCGPPIESLLSAFVYAFRRRIVVCDAESHATRPVLQREVYCSLSVRFMNVGVGLPVSRCDICRRGLEHRHHFSHFFLHLRSPLLAA